MKKILRLITGICLMLYSTVLNAQLGQGDYTSLNAKVDIDVMEGDMTWLNLREVFGTNKDFNGIEYLNGSGRITIKMFQYDPAATSGVGLPMFRMTAEVPGNEIDGAAEDDTTWDGLSDLDPAPDSWSTDDIKLAAFVAEKRRYATSGQTGIYEMFRNPIPVLLETKVESTAMLGHFRIDGIGELDAADFFNLQEKMRIYANPNGYPHFVMLCAHRGYWKDAPENSLESFQNAIDMDVDMIEIDVRLTKDSVVMLAHDFHLGRLATLPARLDKPEYKDENGNVVLEKLTLCDVRPDLCGDPTSEPVMLVNENLQPSEPIPTFEELLQLCKGKIMIDVDKITDFYGSIYKEAEQYGMVNQVIVKGREKDPATMRQNYPDVDWSRLKYTPVYFPDAIDENGNAPDFHAAIETFLSDADFNCPGVELIYLTDDDVLIPEISFIRDTHNDRVLQFPMWPENCGGNFTPQLHVKALIWRNPEKDTDMRNDWEWVLKPEHRADLLISDRLEVLLQLLELKGLRNLVPVN
jgi:glycerophosphoryl diester phosphodiesterase